MDTVIKESAQPGTYPTPPVPISFFSKHTTVRREEIAASVERSSRSETVIHSLTFQAVVLRAMQQSSKPHSSRPSG